MTNNDSVFEQTYQNYLTQISQRNLKRFEEALGMTVHDNEAFIPVFGEQHKVSGKAIAGPTGRRPSFNICIILSKYILLSPEKPTKQKGWVSYRDFKDSGPLLKFYANDVERPIAQWFSGRPDNLREACESLGGFLPDIELAYDVCMQVDVLPKIPLLLLFNDADKDFTSSCSVLFQSNADNYLDAECLAMVGALLFSRLKKASHI